MFYVTHFMAGSVYMHMVFVTFQIRSLCMLSNNSQSNAIRFNDFNAVHKSRKCNSVLFGKPCITMSDKKVL